LHHRKFGFLKILIVTATRIGDAVLSSGLIAYLSKQYPDARFTIACGAPAAPLFEAVPRLDRLIIVEKMSFHRHWLALWLKCIGTRWDRVYDLRSSMLARVLVAAERHIGGYRDDSIHRVEELGHLIDVTPPPAPKIWLSDAAQADAMALMPADRTVLAVGPTANWIGKQWPAERFAELVVRAIAPGGFLGAATVAVLGAPSEREMAEPVLKALPSDRRIDLIGQSLPVAAACIARSRLYVGNDSGLMHIAAAVGTPTLGLFGPSPETRYGPWGDHCTSVRTPESYAELVAPELDLLGPHSRMTGLSVDAVYEALAKFYGNVKDAS
jgi:heptosyltransferase-3